MCVKCVSILCNEIEKYILILNEKSTRILLIYIYFYSRREKSYKYAINYGNINKKSTIRPENLIFFDQTVSNIYVVNNDEIRGVSESRPHFV